MKNKKITRKITQGMYVLTTQGGGCIIDAVSQISAGDNPLIAIAVMKKNYTNELLHKNKYFGLSVIGFNNNKNIISTFGFNSMRDIDKFENIETEIVNETPIIKDSLGYMVCEIVDKYENDTHTLFIGKLIEADVYEDSKPMSYEYYQENKDDLVKMTNSKGKTVWVCTLCGYVYEGEELPEDFKCPLCGAGKEYFEKKEQ